MRFDFTSERIFCLSLDFSHQAKSWLKRVFTRFPACRTYLPTVLGNKLRRLHFSKELFRASADAIVIYFNRLNDTFLVNNERSTKREPLFFYVCPKDSGKISCGVCRHWKLDFSYSGRSIVPCLMRKDSVRAHTHNLHSYFFEFFIIVSHLFKFCRTNKSKICGIKEKNQPRPFKIRNTDFLDFFFVIYLKNMPWHMMPHFHTAGKYFLVIFLHNSYFLNPINICSIFRYDIVYPT